MSSRPSRGAARLAAILDALPDALLLVNRNGTVVNANAMALEALEAPGTPIVGRGLLDLLPTFDRSRIPGSVRAIDVTGDARTTKPARMTARRTDGSLMPVEVTSANLPGAAYDDELLMIVVRDLTGSVDVESELQRQQRQTEMILRAASEGIVGIDADGSIVLVNPAAARILRHRAGDLGGRSLHELLMAKRADGTPLPPDECPALVTLQTGKKQRLRDQVLWRGDGESVPVEMTTAPILLGEAVVGAVMTFTDLSRERAIAEQRDQLAELLDTELLSRFEASRARLKTLADGSIGELGPSARRVVRQVAGELEEMSGLSTEILEHQRGEKKEPAERTAAMVDDLLDRALETVTYPARAAGVEFTVTAAPMGVQVDVDAMTRALGHLIADTVGAVPKGSTVAVTAEQHDKVARIEVRGPASRGSSVHVPLARAIIEAHGGTVESRKADDAGGYIVELPTDEEAAAKARPKDAGEPGSDRARARKRARTSPAVRPGTTAEAAPAKADAEEPAKDGRDAKEPPGDARADDETAKPDDGDRTDATKNSGAARDGSSPDGDGGGSPPAVRTPRGTGLEPANPAGPPTPAVPRPVAPRPMMALPAGESSPGGGAPHGGAGAVSEAHDGRRAARRALPTGPSGQDDGGSRGAQGGSVPPQASGESTGDAQEDDGHTPREAAQDGAAAPGVPARVNGHHTRHMARARHQLSTPPAPVPSQSRLPGAPGAGGRGTSVRDRPDTPPSGGPGTDLEPTGYRKPPEPPQPPPVDTDAPTALMPPVPAPPTVPAPGQAQIPHPPNPAQHRPGDEPPYPPAGRRRRAIGTGPGQPPGDPAQLPGPPQPGAPGAYPAPDGGDPNAAHQPYPQQPGPYGAPGVPPYPHDSGAHPVPGQHDPRAHGSHAAHPEAIHDAYNAPGARPEPLPQRNPGGASYPGSPAQPPHPGPSAFAPPPPPTPPALPSHAAPHGPPRHSPVAPLLTALDIDTPPPGELAAVDPNYPPMVAPSPDGRPRRLLVWPAPDGPTSNALAGRGWDPVLVRSRDEVNAQAGAHPAALFVDPLTGPITRTALHSLRTAATAAEIPVLVTAGLMQATRDAAFGADPAVLLRSLAPADSAAHASRVLLVEANHDIATAFTGSLARRGMDVAHVTSESEAVSKAASVEPNLVVLDLMLVRRRRLGIVDWLRNNDRLHSTPIVVYTTVDIAEEDLPRLQTGETVLFLAERSTREDVQQRVVDLLGKIASLV
ncbi:PAS domain-containing protein [Yinghuangia sp. ASG 101]|uniref:PAS domain-containing protein n=1 Tax=Yinghuangia sp. ASG 101 TaxID=2896848 RepID=UPI001E354ACE|nr:PAS domain-containing protein [Yinghuangia sp. ASG 101]UGQ08933.1 PAS domain-containing protein [Yinghuangia sp. ASG 101]